MPAKSNDILIIQGLRGAASAQVCVYHLFAHGQAFFPLIHLAIYRAGPFGVDVFFVLSGFVIPFSMSRAGYEISSYPRFILKRGLHDLTRRIS